MPITSPNMAQTTWNTLSTTVLPRWYDRNKAVDVVSKGYPLLKILLAKADVRKNLPYSEAIRLMDVLNTAEAYSYYDSVSTTPVQGTTAGEITYCNYSSPLAMSEQEEDEFTSDEAIANRMKQMVVQTELGFGRRLCIDMYAGNGSNAKRITGLEQIIHAKSHSLYSATDSIDVSTNIPGGDHWRYRQTTSSYAGITRAAYTADEAGGTGWENLSCNWKNTDGGAETNKLGIDTSAPYGPSSGLRNLVQIFNVAAYGLGGSPDLIVCSPRAYNDYEFAVQTKQVIYRTPTYYGDGELTLEGLAFKGRTLIYDEWAKTWGVTSSDATTNNPLIYGINTETLGFEIDARKNFNLSVAKSPVDQFASVQFMRWRGQLRCVSPRNQFVIFNYASAS